MNPKISVVVPCYNQAQYLGECLQSVLEQTYQNWECIIVNDGSPDNTEEIAQRWIAKDSRFKYLKKENGGLSSARNAGIEIANGEWILPLDSDDKIGNRYLELAEKEFDKGYQVIYCEADYFGDEQGRWILPTFSLKNLSRDNCIFCSAFYPKTIWQQYGGYDENMRTALEDWEFWIRIIQKDTNVFKLDYNGFYYRIKSQSMITRLDYDKIEDAIKYLERKHITFFQYHCDSYNRILRQNRLLKNEVSHLTTIVASKRYRKLDKILSFFRM